MPRAKIVPSELPLVTITAPEMDTISARITVTWPIADVQSSPARRVFRDVMELVNAIGRLRRSLQRRCRLPARRSVFIENARVRWLMARPQASCADEQILRKRITAWEVPVHILRGDLLGDDGARVCRAIEVTRCACPSPLGRTDQPPLGFAIKAWDGVEIASLVTSEAEPSVLD